MTEQDMTDKADKRLSNMSASQLHRVIAMVRSETGKWHNEARRQNFLTRLIEESERRDWGGLDLPSGFDRKLGEFARVGYEAYGTEADWKAYNGELMPQWDALPGHIQTKWTAAAAAIAKALSEA